MAQYKNQQGRTLFKRSALAACVMAVSAAHVYAQEKDAQDPALLEEVVVYGIKQSLENAQDIKREASTVKDVITASDIGALPDKSVVEALQRIPGVAIDRFEATNDPDHFAAEGGGVTIRGLDRTRSEFNGRDSFSAANDGKMEFADIPPELVSTVEVVKNTTADMIEGGTAGTVNVITRKPFDKEELQLAGTVKGAFGDAAEKFDPNLSGIASNVWDTNSGKFGALVSVTASKTQTRGDGMGLFNFYEYQALSTPQQKFIAPEGVRINSQINERDRLGFSSAFQYSDPSETVKATFEFIRSDSQYAWVDRFLENPEQPFGDTRGNADNLKLSANSSFACSQDVFNGDPCQFQSGTIQQVNYIAGIRTREEDRIINDASLKFEVTPNDNLTLVADLQYVNATFEAADLSGHGNAGRLDVAVDLRNSDDPKFRILGNNPKALGNYFYRSAMDFAQDSEGEQIAVSGSAKYDFDDAWVKSIQVGTRFSQKELDARESAYSWGNISESWAGGVSTYDQQLVDSGLIETYSFNDHMGGGALFENSTFWFPAESFLKRGSESYFQALNTPYALGKTLRQNTTGWVPLALRSGVTDATSPFRPSEVYNTEETRGAFYIRLDFGDEAADKPYSGNVGLRYVSYDLTNTGAINFPQSLSAALLAVNSTLNPRISANDIAFNNGAAGASTTVEAENFSRVLPSFNFKLELQEDLIARFAASESIYLPEMNDVRINANIGSTVTVTNAVPGDATSPITGAVLNGYTARGGNPNLAPEVTSNYDLTLEWYFADLGSVTATWFYKNNRDFFRRGAETVEFTNPVSGAVAPVSVTALTNQGKSTIQGYELSAQSDFSFIHDSLEPFGASVGYTFIDGKESTPDVIAPDAGGRTFRNFSALPIEGLSKENIGLQLFYDDSTFQTRFAYSWRSEWLMNSRDVIAFSPVYGEPTGQLDWSASYKIGDNYKVGLEASNLLSEVVKTSLQYNQEGVKTPRSYFVADRRFAAYVQATF